MRELHPIQERLVSPMHAGQFLRQVARAETGKFARQVRRDPVDQQKCVAQRNVQLIVSVP